MPPVATREAFARDLRLLATFASYDGRGGYFLEVFLAVGLLAGVFFAVELTVDDFFGLDGGFAVDDFVAVDDIFAGEGAVAVDGVFAVEGFFAVDAVASFTATGGFAIAGLVLADGDPAGVATSAVSSLPPGAVSGGASSATGSLFGSSGGGSWLGSGATLLCDRAGPVAGVSRTFAASLRAVVAVSVPISFTASAVPSAAVAPTAPAASHLRRARDRDIGWIAAIAGDSASTRGGG